MAILADASAASLHPFLSEHVELIQIRRRE
jgi:hypothetical protein